MHQLTVTVLLIATTVQVSAQFDTLAENLYSRLSGACRALMSLQHDSMNSQNEILSTMKIYFLNGDEMRSFPIDHSYKGLIKPSIFDIAKETKIIIHGYRDNAQSSVSLDLAKAYDEKKMFNVLLVDSEEMMNKNYLVSVHNARLIGKRLANLLANLEDFGANAADFHLLGISLGAHIAGWTGKYFQRYKMAKLGRITGLDPAGPCFSSAYSEQRLDKMDAEYVDIIHTNKLVQGITEALGHVDFYVNGGGPMQPGCIMPSCSHLRAAKLYLESVETPKSIIGVKCKSWKQFESNACDDKDFAVLGYGSSTSTRGVYFLRTSASAPFGLGVGGTKNNEGTVNPWEGLVYF
ncbi:phospholipase A1-like isoform X1 [Pieris brassicae]|uniref:phospholipase A1-like isoform X1 n=2 Tax=Pieris brassicae TaxID=7116 RepID=UPI001E661262|nr:phospholipase A1-like isoform X1 [Pieris brassicae]